MKHYDRNFKNLTINGIQFLDGDKINERICLRQDSIVNGNGISITVSNDGKLTISLNTEGSDASNSGSN